MTQGRAWERYAWLKARPLTGDRPDELADFLVYKPEPKVRPWRLLRTDGGFRVLGTPPSNDELERALKAAGARKGAVVEVGDEELELA